MSLENNAADDWLRLSELVEAIDLFYDTHLSSDRPRSVQSAVSRVNNYSGSLTGNFSPRVSLVKSGPSYVGNSQEGKQHSPDNAARSCYVCGSYKHLAIYHGKPGSTVTVLVILILSKNQLLIR